MIYLMSFMYAVGDNEFNSIKLALSLNNHQYALVCGPLYCLSGLFAAFGSGWLALRIDSSLLLALSSVANVAVNAMYYGASRSTRPFLVICASHVLMGAAAGMQKLTSTLVTERVRLTVIGRANGVVWTGPYAALSLSIMSGCMALDLGWLVMCEIAGLSAAVSAVLLLTLPRAAAAAADAPAPAAQDKVHLVDLAAEAPGPAGGEARAPRDGDGADDAAACFGAGALRASTRRRYVLLTLAWGFIFAAREVVWAWVFIVWYDEWPVRTYAAAAWTTAAGAVTLGALGSWAGGALGGALRPGRADVDLLIILAGTVVSAASMALVLVTPRAAWSIGGYLGYLFSSATLTAPAGLGQRGQCGHEDVRVRRRLDRAGAGPRPTVPTREVALVHDPRRVGPLGLFRTARPRARGAARRSRRRRRRALGEADMWAAQCRR